MTEAMPFLQKCDITFLRPPTIVERDYFLPFLNSSLDIVAKNCRWCGFVIYLKIHFSFRYSVWVLWCVWIL